MTRLYLLPDARAAIARHARAAGDHECCGGLFGHIGAQRRVVRATPSPNLHARPRRAFLIGADDVLRLDADAAALGLALLGFYHSHPRGSAVPSTGDLSTAWPWYSYIIAGRGEMRAWRLRDDRSRFEPESIESADVPHAAMVHP